MCKKCKSDLYFISQNKKNNNIEFIEVGNFCILNNSKMKDKLHLGRR